MSSPEQNFFLTWHDAATGAVGAAAILAGGAAKAHRRRAFDKNRLAAGEKTGRSPEDPGRCPAADARLVAVTLGNCGVEMQRVHAVDKDLGGKGAGLGKAAFGGVGVGNEHNAVWRRCCADIREAEAGAAFKGIDEHDFSLMKSAKFHALAVKTQPFFRLDSHFLGINGAGFFHRAMQLFQLAVFHANPAIEAGDPLDNAPGPALHRAPDSPEPRDGQVDRVSSELRLLDFRNAGIRVQKEFRSIERELLLSTQMQAAVLRGKHRVARQVYLRGLGRISTQHGNDIRPFLCAFRQQHCIAHLRGQQAPGCLHSPDSPLGRFDDEECVKRLPDFAGAEEHFGGVVVVER